MESVQACSSQNQGDLAPAPDNMKEFQGFYNSLQENIPFLRPKELGQDQQPEQELPQQEHVEAKCDKEPGLYLVADGPYGALQLDQSFSDAKIAQDSDCPITAIEIHLKQGYSLPTDLVGIRVR